MTLANRFYPLLLLLGTMVLLSGQCEDEPRTEEEFVQEEIIRADRNNRLNGLEDLLHFAAQQELNACQQGCESLEEKVQNTAENVAALEKILISFGKGIKPPPPPCPCNRGNCAWERLAIFDYFVDLANNGGLPTVRIENLNGQVLSSSDKAKVTYSPEERFAVVNLPTADFDDEAVNIVIDRNDGTAKVLVNIVK